MGRIVVTGAAGFIGRSRVDVLGEAHDVHCIVRSAENLPAHWPARFGITECTIGPNAQCSAVLEGADAVIHLAALAHRSAPDPGTLSAVNVEGARRLAEQAARAGVGRFVLMSSIGVNGNRTVNAPFDETMPPDPHDSYARSKLDAELAVREVADRESMEAVIVRPPLVYGAHAPGNFGRLVRWVRRGIPLPFGALDNRRSLVSLHNLCDFVTVAVSHREAANRVFLVSDGEDISTPQLIRELAAAMDRPARLVSVPPWSLRAALTLLGRGQDFERLCGSLRVDASFAGRTLGWSPPWSLREGLRRATVETLGAAS